MVLARSLVFFVALLLVTVAYSVPLALFGWAASFETRARVGRTWGSAILRLLRVICRLDYHIEGAANLPKAPCIVMSKHQSSWETIALRALLDPNHTWVLKRELLRIPFFGWALALFRPIAIDREAGRAAAKQLLREGKKALDDGLSVVIFPEGTRVAPGSKGRYGIGGALLAEHTGARIVPIAHNAGVFWARREIRKYPGTIQVVVGTPIETTGLSPLKINKAVEQWIEEQMERIPRDRSDTRLT